MDLTGKSQDLQSTVAVLVTQSFTMLKLSCLFGIRTFCTVISTWMEVLRTSVILHRDLVSGFVVWFYAIVSFPVRALTAVYRERQMALDDFASNDKQLREHLKSLTRKCRAMEEIIQEFDDEYDEALLNIQKLQHQLQNAKHKEIHYGEASSKHQIAKDMEIQDKEASHNKHKGMEIQDKEASSYKPVQGEDDQKDQDHSLQSQNMKWEAEISEMREWALRQTIFGALLCPLVGMVIWESKDPCMSLVMALYAVVAVSLTTVLKLFRTIDKIKPALATDAVAMLSFNCFLLGTLTYPTLPKLAPPAMELLERTGLAGLNVFENVPLFYCT